MSSRNLLSPHPPMWLNGDPLICEEMSSSKTYNDFGATVDEGGMVYHAPPPTGTVDLSKPGQYQVTYSLGSLPDQIRTVNVCEFGCKMNKECKPKPKATPTPIVTIETSPPSRSKKKKTSQIRNRAPHHKVSESEKMRALIRQEMRLVKEEEEQHGCGPEELMRRAEQILCELQMAIHDFGKKEINERKY